MSQHASPLSKVQIGTRSYDVQELQELIPNLEESIRERDRCNSQLKDALQAQSDKMKDLEKELEALKVTCDKLRSVLNQKSDIYVAPTPKASDEDMEGGHISVNKKIAVSAEPALIPVPEEKLPKCDKPAASKKVIKEAIATNNFLKCLGKDKVHQIIEAMFPQRAVVGEWVITEGDVGDKLYVLVAGEVEVSREDTVIRVVGAPTVIGELAVLYNCARTASIRATCDCELFVLRREDYKSINTSLSNQAHVELLCYLQKVAIFAELPLERISRLADVVDKEYYAPNEVVILQGDVADTFFLLMKGQVRVTQQFPGEKTPREVRVLGTGDFFGEKALYDNEPRTASIIAMEPGIEVLALDRGNFLKLCGDIAALKKDYGDADRSKQPPIIVEPPSQNVPEKEFAALRFEQLQRITTLGIGGFGRVELVAVDGDRNRTFALKTLKKKHIVETKQQEHIFSEKSIMMQLRSDWIVRLYTTFRDKKCIHMLLEVCLGGELWSTLRDKGHFDDYSSRFYVGCVVEALEYLHRRQIVYRDLKPENCILNERGYLKLVDFGFAKKLTLGRKTWTFCGTPEYLSPEMILNKGHDHAVDYWALGIYMCELLLGKPPFQASNPMKTYTLILGGIDALDIPNRRVGKTAISLVKILCRNNPGERLGSGVAGIGEIRKHRWFMGFDWEALRAKTMDSPIVPKVASADDTKNFDHFADETDIAPDETSGWDNGF